MNETTPDIDDLYHRLVAFMQTSAYRVLSSSNRRMIVEVVALIEGMRPA